MWCRSRLLSRSCIDRCFSISLPYLQRLCSYFSPVVYCLVLQSCIDFYFLFPFSLKDTWKNLVRKGDALIYSPECYHLWPRATYSGSVRAWPLHFLAYSSLMSPLSSLLIPNQEHVALWVGYKWSLDFNASSARIIGYRKDCSKRRGVKLW